MIEFVEFKNERYPKFQADGNAARWIKPFAEYYCNGKGYDIGCNRLEWCLNGAMPIDKELTENQYEANCLPTEKVDYIFSSHCLEHIPDWVGTLDYWLTKVKKNGIIFLYLPHKEQRYWQPQNNRKHIHSFVPQDIINYLEDRNITNYIFSERDLNHSFTVVFEV